MKIILLKDVPKVGQIYDIKKVSDGYALNFLIPRKLAKIATNSSIKELEEKKQKNEAERKEKIDILTENLAMLKNVDIMITAKANDEGHLFAGISKSDIVTAIKKEKSIEINPELIDLEIPIKEIGEHTLQAQIGEDKIKFKVTITKEK